MGYGKCKFVVPGPQKKNLRLAIKGMALASSEKALKQEAIFNLVYVLNKRTDWC